MSKMEQITKALVARDPKLELVRAAVRGKTDVMMAVVGEVYEVWNWSATVTGGLYHGAVGLSYDEADALYEDRKQATYPGHLSHAV